MYVSVELKKVVWTGDLEVPHLTVIEAPDMDISGSRIWGGGEGRPGEDKRAQEAARQRLGWRWRGVNTALTASHKRLKMTAQGQSPHSEPPEIQPSGSPAIKGTKQQPHPDREEGQGHGTGWSHALCGG